MHSFPLCLRHYSLLSISKFILAIEQFIIRKFYNFSILFQLVQIYCLRIAYYCYGIWSALNILIIKVNEIVIRQGFYPRQCLYDRVLGKTLLFIILYGLCLISEVRILG